MESRGIEIVTNKFNIPHIFIKVPYDRIGQETKNFNKEEACNKLANNIHDISTNSKIKLKF